MAQNFWSSPPLWARVAAAVACGVAMFSGVPDDDHWWLGFCGWIPLLWAIEGVGWQRATWLGLVAGTTAILGGFSWIGELLTRFAGMPWYIAVLGQLGFSLYHGLQWGLSALLWQRCRALGLTSPWWIAVGWAAVETTLPNVFPTYMAFMWCWQPSLIQHAELFGVAFVGFTMLAINSFGYAVLTQLARAARPRVPDLLTWTALLVLLPSYGQLRIRAIEQEMAQSPQLKVGVVQGNFGIETYSRPRLKPRLLRELQRETARLEREGAQLALWGETAYPYGWSFFRDSTGDLPSPDPRRVRRGFDIPVIVGLATSDRTQENPYVWNTAWVLDAQGRWGDRFDKNYPLIFGEWIPLVDPQWYLDLIPTASYINRGDGPSVLNAAGFRFGPLVCYEDILPEFVRKTSLEDVHALVNLTNDSWFGATREQNEHLGLSVFRTIEVRRALLRSVNAGVSAHITPTGLVAQRLEVTDSDTDGYRGAQGFVAEVAMMDPEQRTLYARTGHGFAVLMWLSLAVAIGLRIAAARRRRSSDTRC